jgi:hypothetical protein
MVAAQGTLFKYLKAEMHHYFIDVKQVEYAFFYAESYREVTVVGAR